MRWFFTSAAALLVIVGMSACKDIDRFSTKNGDYYCGQIVDAQFVRRGFRGADAGSVWMRLTLDANHLNDSPGVLSTNDGLLVNAPLRPLPELSNDPLWTFSFGEGREKNLLFAIDPSVATGGGPTMMAFISLMHSGDAEVRLVRGAPQPASQADAGSVDGEPLFGVFAPLRRQEAQRPAPVECSF
jgi:hypothetical protein